MMHPVLVYTYVVHTYIIHTFVPDPSVHCTWAVCGRFARGTASPVSGSFSKPHSLATIVKCGLVKHNINGVRFRLLAMLGSIACVSKIDLVFGSSMNFKASRYLCRSHIRLPSIAYAVKAMPRRVRVLYKTSFNGHHHMSSPLLA